MKIAVILNYTNYEQTISCVNFLINSKVDHVVVVDNNSQNKSVEYLEMEYDHVDNVDVIASNFNGGYAKGNNIGLRFVELKFGISKNNVIYIINPDSVATPDNVNSMFIAINELANSGMVTTLINGTTKSAWHHITSRNALVFNFWVIRWILNKIGINEGRSYLENREAYLPVDVISGAFFAIRQDIFKEVGYFDENTFMYYEEEILYKKLSNIGYQNYLITTSDFKHEGRGSTNLSKTRFKRINDESRLYLLKEYYNVGPIYVMFTLFVNYFDNILLRLLRR